MQQTDYERRGYLHEDYRLFHLSSALAEDTAFHYHEFHKLVFFLAGRGNYIVEGRTHVLRPYDVVLVRQGAIHKAQIDPNERYERVILYISPEFLRAQSTAASQLDACFRLPADGQSFVLRPEAGRRAALLRTLDALEAEERSMAYGHDLLARVQALTGSPFPPPPRFAGEPPGRMATCRLRMLGWRPGGWGKLDGFLAGCGFS